MTEAIAEIPGSTRKLVSPDQKDGGKENETGGNTIKTETSAAVDDPRLSTGPTLFASSSPSFWNRKLDGLYLVFFLTHIPIILLVDIVPLYPRALVPPLLLRLRAWYIAQYADRFFSETASPAWFRFYLWMEVGYHLPLSAWAVRGLWVGDSPLLPLQLLLFAFQTALTTATCLADMLAWPTPTEEKMALAQIYVPYLIFGLIMGFDMYCRVRRDLIAGTSSSSGRKRGK